MMKSFSFFIGTTNEQCLSVVQTRAYEIRNIFALHVTNQHARCVRNLLMKTARAMRKSFVVLDTVPHVVQTLQLAARNNIASRSSI